MVAGKEAASVNTTRASHFPLQAHVGYCFELSRQYGLECIMLFELLVIHFGVSFSGLSHTTVLVAVPQTGLPCTQNWSGVNLGVQIYN